MDAFWQNFTGGPGYAPAAFHRDSLGVVRLKGLVELETDGPSPGTVFVLPPGYRPAERLVFGGRAGGGGAFGSVRVDVVPDGSVAWVKGDGGPDPTFFLSLDEISFRRG